MAGSQTDPTSISDDNQQAMTKTGKLSIAKRGLKVHTCFCGKTFSRAEHLRRHQISHDEDFQLVCPHPGCGRPFFREDLFKKHQKRHAEPESRLASTQGIPGYSIVPIKVSKTIRSSPKSQKSHKQSTEPSVRTELRGVDVLQPFQDTVSRYISRYYLENYGGHRDDVDDDYIQPPTRSQEAGSSKLKTALHFVEVERSVGWNVDPFTKLPKFRDRRINTTEIYQHCLAALGRVGKSPAWVKLIVEDKLGFLSSLTIAAAHRDLLRGLEAESAVTLAAKYEVLQMIRDSTMTRAAMSSDMTYIAITQLLSAEIVFGNRDVSVTHMNGLLSIANLRGGLKNLGWSDELGAMSAGKIMIVAISHDIECPDIFTNASFSLQPHLPNLCQLVPESPGCWTSKDLSNLRRAKNCSPETRGILIELRALTEQFLDCCSLSSGALFGEPAKEVLNFRSRATVVHARFLKRRSNPTDPYYEVVRLVALVYTTALLHRIPFADASTMIAPDFSERIISCLLKTDIVTCWQGDMAGVFIWTTLIGSAITSPLKSRAGKRAGPWLRLAIMYGMILLSTEHADVYFENCRSVLLVQGELRKVSSPQLAHRFRSAIG